MTTPGTTDGAGDRTAGRVSAAVDRRGLHADPALGWREEDEDGGFVMSWPVYDDVVKEFFEAAGQDC